VSVRKATGARARRRTDSHKEMDWSVLRERLARARAANERRTELNAEEAARVLEDRARAFAAAARQVPEQRETIELMLFDLARERYALESRYVLRVVALTEIVPVPRTTELLVGITNLQGEILPVFDLRPLVGLPSVRSVEASRIVVLGERAPDLGIVADAVHEVLRLPVETIGDPPDSIAETEEKLLRGVTRDGLIVLRAEAVLSDPRLTAGSRAPPGPPSRGR
jgi:purine-binding chemotaxis protein CheW